MRDEPVWRRYLRLFGPNVDADVDDELRFHLDARAAEYRARGLSERDAHEAARARFGDLDPVRRALSRRGARRQRRTDRAEWWHGIAQDLRLAGRMLRQRPGFSGAVIGVLGLGIGAATAMFSAVDAALFRPLPFAEPHRLVAVQDATVPARFPGYDPPRDRPRTLDLADLSEMGDVVSRVAAYATGGLNLSDPERPVRVTVGVVTADFFGTLGVAAAQGRTFAPEEGIPDGPAVTLLSDGLWRRHFGGAPVVGTTVRLSGRPHTVIGVMSRGFRFPEGSDLWIPLTVPATPRTFEAFRGWLPARIVARLADGVAPDVAAARLAAAWERVTADHPDLGNVMARIRAGSVVSPLQRSLAGERRTALLFLLAATGFLLLIACANVTNLLLSRAAVRKPEIAVRVVLGATRGRVMRQLLTESVVLALLGAAAGLVLAPVTLRLADAVFPDTLEGLASARIDVRVLGFGTLVAVATGLAFGLWPALGATRPDVGASLSGGGGRTATAGAAGRARRVLLAAEVALTVTLLIGAGLMFRSLARVLGEDWGMNPARVATAELSFGRAEGNADRPRALVNAALARLAMVPGVDAAGAVNDLPLRGGAGGIAISVEADGRLRPAGEDGVFARYLRASAGYFRAMGIPLLRGRLFEPGDDGDTHPVIVISHGLARHLWPDQDPLGRGLRIGGDSTSHTVIGVVGDVREQALDQAPLPQMYLPITSGLGGVALVARGALPADVLLRHLREAVRAADPAQAVFNVRTMDEVVRASLAPRRHIALLIGAFGGLALLVAALGVYGVVSYSVAQRTRELGIRSALGASARGLAALVAREMVWVVAIGSVLGLAGAWMAARLLESQLYGVSARDALAFAVAPLVLLVTVVVATLVPARRATRVNVMEVIRAE